MDHYFVQLHTESNKKTKPHRNISCTSISANCFLSASVAFSATSSILVASDLPSPSDDVVLAEFVSTLNDHQREHLATKWTLHHQQALTTVKKLWHTANILWYPVQLVG